MRYLKKLRKIIVIDKWKVIMDRVMLNHKFISSIAK
jgi:hypothetical protein